jgi:UDP-N-acetylglucosamine 2-epimerase (non-hydrolysing)/GDP/UDP-N,N'-diacetylbacillosamine 2-epimerase (hydrolysing)
MPHPTRKICFVTGTRAEFGLMESTLHAIAGQRGVQLQLVVTGMHLDPAHGRSIDLIRKQGWTIDAVVPWKQARGSQWAYAKETGRAMAALAGTFERLKSDVVLVVGDRVEAVAAASAGHLSRKILAHVHGGDRAEGQVDDSLRHAITKLSHIHFPATPGSARRLVKLGEDRRRIHQVGSPGLDGIVHRAAKPAVMAEKFPQLSRGEFALIVLHPTDNRKEVEFDRAGIMLSAAATAGIAQTVVVYPNSDPGSRQIIRCWRQRREGMTYLLPDVSRDLFLGLMRDCRVMMGNSSAGIIEAGALGTAVVNVGHRQAGRERGANVIQAGYAKAEILKAIKKALRRPRTGRPDKSHPYGGGGASKKIATVLGELVIDDNLRRKLITY